MKRPERVLHVVHNFPPEFRGGVERVVESAVVAQRRAGVDARVLCGSEETRDVAGSRAEEFAGIPVVRLFRGPGLKDPVDPFRAELATHYEAALAAFAPEVVHVHHWSNLGDDMVRRAARRGARVVATLHDFFPTCPLFFRLPGGTDPCDLPQAPENCGPCISRTFGFGEVDEASFRVETRRLAFAEELRAATFVTAASPAHARAIAPFLPEPTEIVDLPLGSEPIEPVPPRPRTGPLRVLHFGNLCRLKGVEILARAVEAADPSGERIRLTMLGHKLEADLYTGRAEIVPGYEWGTLRDYAADSDVAAFPSLARETYSMTVDEALRLGLPTLVGDRGAAQDRVGARGVVLPSGDVAAWAAELRRLAGDPAAAPALRAGAHAPLASNLDYGDRALELYARALERPPSVVDLEPLMLRRLVRLEQTLGDLLMRLYAARRGESAS